MVFIEISSGDVVVSLQLMGGLSTLFLRENIDILMQWFSQDVTSWTILEIAVGARPIFTK